MNEPHETECALKRTRMLERVRHAAKPMLPGIVGLAFARISIMAINQTDPLQSDGDMLTSGASVAKCLAFVVLLGILLVKDRDGGSRDGYAPSFRLATALVLSEAAAFAALGLFEAAGATGDVVDLLRTEGSVIGTGAIFFWVVAARGVGPSKAILYIASSRLLAELPLMAMSFFPEANPLLGMAGLAGQLACVRWLKRRPMLTDAGLAAARNAGESPTKPRVMRYLGGFEDQMKDGKFLASCIVSFAMISVSAGLLRGFPDGGSIPLSPPTYLAMTLAMVVFYSSGIAFSLKTSPLRFIAAGWSLVQAIGALSILAYAFFPDQPEFGAALARAFNDMLHAFRIYLAVALMGLGWRNPYYYAVVTYLVFLFPRALARTGLAVGDASSDPARAVVLALAAIMLVIAGQLLFQRVLGLLASSASSKKTAQSSPTSSLLEKALGIDQTASLSDIRAETMRRHVAKLGERFDLSEREMEVLALFASGHTQKRVAEELYITLNTAHAHIRHVYAKTGCHSRQEVLNLISKLDEEQ